jgi:phosphate/sulfate permease
MELAAGIGLAAIIALAAFDLWVGVANDAVNFLNSAIGSRVAPRRAILTIAGVGVLLGALTSNGLMDVARRGVFDPDRFIDPATGQLMVFAILAVYLGVMAADVILLDLFNTFGLPTSTTVSIISELVGASIAVALWMTPGGVMSALSVIQTGPVLGIYTGIFLSVLVAFSVSAVLMFLIRLLYGHDLERTFPRMGWLWVGLSFSALSYFVLFKGLTNARMVSPAVEVLLRERAWLILAATFGLGAAVSVIFRRNVRGVLGVIILSGTGALALAFAGNDLVNFIGPSVAAAQAVLVQGVELSGQVPTPPWALILAGAIMVASLVTSQKARRVTDTEVRLAAHGATTQRFKETGLARGLVGVTVSLWGLATAWIPRGLRERLARRTAPPPPDRHAPPYDLLRASVNLTVAALLISIGTASKLPLSTTYITFTSAMGAALGDRMWGTRDAVQRVSGILVVLGGWLVTGFLAAGGGFIMASVIALGGSWGVLVALLGVAAGVQRLGRIRGFVTDLGEHSGPSGPSVSPEPSAPATAAAGGSTTGGSGVPGMALDSELGTRPSGVSRRRG